MTSSDIRVKTNNQDILKQTVLLRDKLNRSTQFSLMSTPLTKSEGFQCSPLSLKYKRACYSNYVKPNNQITNS